MPKVADVFVCPQCHLSLNGEKEREIQCPSGHRFPLLDTVPDLAPEEIRQGKDWKTWAEHLEAFERRRQARIEQPERVAVRLSDKSKPQRVFADFVELAGDRVLDIGCGPGRFRHRLPENIRYIGIDPLPLLPHVKEFDFARGVSEYIPLPDSSVTDVVILAALDHFHDLNRSFQEIRRVLVPGGRLHIMQSVHQRWDFMREFAHRVKDWLEDRSDEEKAGDVPHHMTEFTPESFRAALDEHFTHLRTKELVRSRFAPRKLMVTVET